MTGKERKITVKITVPTDTTWDEVKSSLLNEFSEVFYKGVNKSPYLRSDRRRMIAYHVNIPTEDYIDVLCRLMELAETYEQAEFDAKLEVVSMEISV